MATDLHQLQPVQLPDHLSIAIGSHGFLHFLANCKTGYFRSPRNENWRKLLYLCTRISKVLIKFTEYQLLFSLFCLIDIRNNPGVYLIG